MIKTTVTLRRKGLDFRKTTKVPFSVGPGWVFEVSLEAQHKDEKERTYIKVILVFQFF